MKCSSDKCHCPRCAEAPRLGDRLIDKYDCEAVTKAARECQDRSLFYTVKPYTWQHGMQGRSGVAYQVIEQRTVATAKCQGDANMIARALNGIKKAEKINEHLTAKVELLEKRTGVSINMVEAVMKAEVQKEARWSSARHDVAEFTGRVMARIHAALD